VAQVLDELAAGALDRNEPRLDRDLDCMTHIGSVNWPFRNSPKATTTPLRPLPESTPNSCLHHHPVVFLVGVGRSSLHVLRAARRAEIGRNVPFSGTTMVSSLWM
jgi:hypothetical protein